MRMWGNDYNRMEFAGAFGDLGTLIPFVVGYITPTTWIPLVSSSLLESSRSLWASILKPQCLSNL